MAYDANEEYNQGGTSTASSVNKFVAKVALYFSLIVLICTLPALTYFAGKKSEHRVRYFSELMEKTRGTKVYVLDMEIVCSNGKDLGRMQADLDLTNGRFVVVRNDSKLQPNCTK